MIACALWLGAAQPSDAQFATAEKTYQYFVEFCLEPFPDMDKICQAVRASGWNAASTQSNAIADWISYDPANQMSPYYLQTKRIGPKSHCSLAYDERIRFPIERLVERYAFQHDRAAGEQFTGWYPERRYEMFAKSVEGVQWNLAWSQSKDGRSGHEISIFNFPVSQ